MTATHDDQPEPRWTVETDNPELKAFIEAELTPVLGQISDEAREEAGRRMLYGTEGEECVKLFDRYAMQRFGDPKEGDILAWLSDGKAAYGHVEIITPKQARHYRRQTWRHRVALVFGWLRGNR